MFMDMALLIEMQGEMIDQIEHNIETSVAYTGKAVDELRKAGKLQKKSRKVKLKPKKQKKRNPRLTTLFLSLHPQKMCILIIVLLIVFVILAGGVGGIVGGIS